MSERYDASAPSVLQSGNWQCSAASAAWLLDAIGHPTTQDDVVAALGPNRIDPSVGLHDHTGSGLVAMLGDPYNVAASSAGVSFDDALNVARGGPLLLGGDRWDHWTGVRGTDGAVLQLANPSPGWDGVGDSMTRDQFDALGPFFAVWPTDVATRSAPVPASPTAPTVAAGGGISLPSWWKLAAGGAALAWALDLLP